MFVKVIPLRHMHKSVIVPQDVFKTDFCFSYFRYSAFMLYGCDSLATPSP